MTLPMRQSPTYDCVLPVSEMKVSFRPFLVKEQKNLMIAGQSEDANDIFKSIIQMVVNVTDGLVDGKKIPMADLEYLFLQIRAKSVGEELTLQMTCTNCEHKQMYGFDLEEVEVDTSTLPEKDIMLNDDMRIEMAFPTAHLAQKCAELDDADEAMKVMLRECIVRLHDEEKTYEFREYRDKEIDEFIDHLTIDEFNKLNQFFAVLPTVSLTDSYECNNCKTKNNIFLQGLQNFF